MIHFSITYDPSKSLVLEEKIYDLVNSYKGTVYGFEYSNSVSAFESSGTIPSKDQLDRLEEDLRILDKNFKRNIAVHLINSI